MIVLSSLVAVYCGCFFSTATKLQHFLKLREKFFLRCSTNRVEYGANDGSRTCDLLITNRVFRFVTYCNMMEHTDTKLSIFAMLAYYFVGMMELIGTCWNIFKHVYRLNHRLRTANKIHHVF